MRNYSALIVIALFIFSCSPKMNPVGSRDEGMNRFPGKAASLTIYEVNIRQHTAEGTIQAFSKDLPRLKELGVGMLWIMPVQPIGIKNRKEPLGSYYSIRDYRNVNEHFGTVADFKSLVQQAHQLGIYVILDWVPNHTAWDHPWITQHPEYYSRDNNGNIVYEADWTDIALLDHLNPATRRAMIDEMKYWVTEIDVDGFRADHAGHEIPLYFWEEATEELDRLKDLFWLAEWDGARMHLEFDATYAWELLHIDDRVGKGTNNANHIARWIQKDLKEYGRKAFRMTMTTNHDENSWSGTEFDRYGEGHKTFAAFIFSAYGLPMLYSGQEAGSNKRLRFFAKDTVDWRDPMQLQPFYKQLVSLRTNNPALWSGEYGGMPERINPISDSTIYAFKRIKGSNKVIGIMNFSDKPQQLHVTDNTTAGQYVDYFTNKQYTISVGSPMQLSAWQYLIFVQN
ncbi:MAG: alpha-amylase [Chitinophagaceae bacterium]|nr:alpha-amylase [Chitinophagaceae bacterium]